MTQTIPERIEPSGLRDYLAILSRAVFQAGLSWRAIAARWDEYERVFSGFDPATVAAFTDADVDAIVAEGRIVRTPRKIRATIANAATLLELDARSGGIRAYLRSFSSYEELATDLIARFKFVGALSAYYFLFLVGEHVPRFEVWEVGIPGDHPRMREMVALARANGYDG